MRRRKSEVVRHMLENGQSMGEYGVQSRSMN